MGDHNEALATIDAVPEDIVRVDTKAVAVLNRSEVEAQLDAAHKYPRSIKRFVAEALTLATMSREVAESCIYALPRGGKVISGKSIRFAEICASAYGNLHVGSRVVDVGERVVTAQGIAWDLEKNLRITVEVDRRITDRKGRRYDDDMITVTGNAAGAIGRRNAIFGVVPQAYVETVFAKVKEVAVGNASTLATRRAEVVARLGKMGVPFERIFARLGKTSIEDVTVEDVETLIGLGTAVKGGDVSIDAAFPPVVSAPVPGAPTAAGATDLETKLRAANGAPPKDKPSSPSPVVQTVTAPTPEPPKVGHRDMKPENCAICAKPLAGQGIDTHLVDGRVGRRHEGCSPFGAGREPGDD